MAKLFDTWRGGGTGRGSYNLRSRSVSEVPLTLHLYSGQVSNGFEIKNSLGTTVFSVSPVGNVTYTGSEQVSDALTVTGVTHLISTLEVDGVSTFDGAIIANSTVQFNGQFNAPTYSYFGIATINTLTVQDTLTIEGTTIINDDLTINLGATEVFTINGIAHNGTNVVSIDFDVNSASVSGLKIEGDVSTALSTGETMNGISIDVDGLAGDHANSNINGLRLTSTNVTGGSNTAINITGAWDTGISVTGAKTLIDAFVNSTTTGYTNNYGVINLNRTGAFTGVDTETAIELNILPQPTITEPGAGSFTFIGTNIDLSGIAVTAGLGTSVITALRVSACTAGDAGTNLALDIVGRSRFAGDVQPTTNDGGALGISGTAWADLFLASGAVIDWFAGDVVITHSANTLTMTGGNFVLTQPVIDSATPTALTVTGGAHTGITAATEDIGINFNLSATKTWAAGAGPLATQREVVIQAPTYAGNAGGALVITNAYSLYVTGAPVQGANMTLTRTWAAGFNGNVGVGAGTALLPSYSFIGYPNTGFYLGAVDDMRIAIGGALSHRFVGSYFLTPAIRRIATGQMSIEGASTDGATAIGLQIGNENALVTAGAKIVSFYSDNLTTGKSFVSKDGEYAQVRGTVQTTDATVTTAATFTLAATSKVYHIKAIIVGRTTSDANRASYELDATVYRAGAGALIQGAITSVHTVESDAAWDATFDVSGNDLRVRVTGVAATTINWASTITYVIVE